MFEFAPRPQNYYQSNSFNQFNPHSKPFVFEMKPQREERDADIFVTNLLQQVSKAHFTKVLSKFGAIAGVSLKPRVDNGITKGQLGYIWCKSPEDRDNILSEAENDPEVNKMFFIRPVIKLFKKAGERKEQSPPKVEEKMSELFTSETHDEYTFTNVSYKNRDSTKDKLADLLLEIQMEDFKRMEVIDEFLDMKKKNLKCLEYPFRKENVKVSSELVKEIHNLLSES